LANNLGNICNDDGSFLLKSKDYNISIEISCLEFENQIVQLDCDANIPIKIILKENINAINEVTVVALSANEIVRGAIDNLEIKIKLMMG